MFMSLNEIGWWYVEAMCRVVNANLCEGNNSFVSMALDSVSRPPKFVREFFFFCSSEVDLKETQGALLE